MTRRYLAVLVSGLASVFAVSTAWAAGTPCTVAINSASVDLGKIVRGTTTTTFTLPPGGPPATQSPSASTAGAAIMLHPSSVAGDPIQVQVTTASGCHNSVTITVNATSTTNPSFSPASPGAFTMSNLTGATLGGSTTIANGGTYALTFPNGNGMMASFRLGLAVQLAADGHSGAAAWTISVSAN